MAAQLIASCQMSEKGGIFFITPSGASEAPSQQISLRVLDRINHFREILKQ